jgi:VIT1/CCC1 family predicted Fe2+/Mn2+ transporter
MVTKHTLSPKILAIISQAQRTELTEHEIYRRLARIEKDPENRQTLHTIAEDEKKHAQFWQQFTQESAHPRRASVFMYYWTARLLGLTFGLRFMEKGEANAQEIYTKIADTIPQAKTVLADEERHEQQLIQLINEERLEYVGSVVLGLNDALVELTGALAGLTLALQRAELIATAGLITGIAAAFSMAASEYLSTKTEANGKKALKASLYTGIAYIGTVSWLIFPYLVIHDVYLSLAWTMVNALLVILGFTGYIAIAKNLSFRKRFTEMAGLSLSVALISFLIGFVVRTIIGVAV